MSEAVEERFWGRVDRTNGCWLWLSTKGTDGYGIFSVGGRKIRVHRYSWITTNGPIPDGLNICHACDVPLCVRPDHLFLGNQRVNMIDASQKGRLRNQYKESPTCRSGHAYTAENTYLSPQGTRICRMCRREYQRRVRQRRKVHGYV